MSKDAKSLNETRRKKAANCGKDLRKLTQSATSSSSLKDGQTIVVVGEMYPDTLTVGQGDNTNYYLAYDLKDGDTISFKSLFGTAVFARLETVDGLQSTKIKLGDEFVDCYLIPRDQLTSRVSDRATLISAAHIDNDSEGNVFVFDSDVTLTAKAEPNAYTPVFDSAHKPPKGYVWVKQADNYTSLEV